MSQRQNKRDQYVYKILSYCYYEVRKTLIEKGHYHCIHLRDRLISRFPNEDKIVVEAAYSKLITNGCLNQKRYHSVTLTYYGVLYFERIYKPEGMIHFTSLIFPILRICNNLLENKERIENNSYFVEKLKEQEDLIINENEHLEVLYILKKMGLISLIEHIGGFIYQTITSHGVNYLLDQTPPNIIESIIGVNTNKFLNLDYFPKEKTQIYSRLINWVEQFSDDDDKKTAVFLIENLWIVSNQWCIDKFNEFYEDKLSIFNIDDIFIFPAGGSGSSAEYWRHKFVRNVSGGKEKSRTLKTLKKEISQDFWDKKVVLFIDDIVGSGDQFLNFVDEYLTNSKILQQRFQNSQIIYFTPVASEFGIEKILKIIPNGIEISYGKQLKKLFDDENPIWSKSTILPKKKIEEICIKYGTKLKLLPESILGYKDSQLLVTFQDHTPDNTIPLLWLENEDWQKLLQR